MFLADTTGYEFAKSNDLPNNIIKGSLAGAIEKDIREFLDMLYAEFVRKKDAMTNNNCYNLNMSSISIVLIDDIYILLENVTSQKYIDNFLEVITTGWVFGFRFVFFCQDYHYAYMKLPMIVREMIDQKIHLSPYKKNDIIEFFREEILDDEIDDNEERFSIIIKKKDREHLEKGRLFI